MDADQLLATVAGLVWPDFGELTCDEPGHPAGHVCLPVSASMPVNHLVETIDDRYGSPHSHLPSLPCDEEIDWLCAWAFGGRWIAFGHFRSGVDARPVVTVTERSTPSPDQLPAEASWLDRLVAITGWAPGQAHEVDWAAVESRLGTRLPTDYKRLVETFGEGQFDGFLDVYLPETMRQFAACEAALGQQPWEPHPPFPAPDGLLAWAGNEHEQAFYWITESPDPDQWPIYATGVGPEEGHRFDCSTTEFLFRQLTDRRHPFSIPADFHAHWFLSYNGSGELS
ncbi:SMI1/KNR4 family protein [Streptomyces sp. NPDC052013]|uniref:SMI1/KNR4 family protein n=1 Tax=Streptomyces sp. NPDC052013 TaxID=3365679 RepID=UPI0037D34716